MDTSLNATAAPVCPQNGTAHDGTLLCHWANSPGGRGTLNIFWLCISTLGLCVWNAVHPDIPRPKTPWWRVFAKRLWMLFVGLFMPEMLVLVALSQLRLAWKLLVDVDEEDSCPTEFPWWMYLVKSWRPKNGNPDSPAKRWMRALRRWMARRLADNSPGPADSDSVALNCAREHPWTLTHSFYAVMGGFVHNDGVAVNIDSIPRRLGLPPGDPERIYDRSLERFRRIALPVDDPNRIPDVSVDDIDDRGKAGVLAKSLLVWQLFVFLANCFARWDQSLPLSLLEITTIGHSLCSIIAMVLWWYKPHSIGEATVIGRNGPLPSLPDVEWREVFSWSFLRGSFNEGAVKVLPELGSEDSEDMDVLVTVTIAVIAALYGLPHLLGLSVHFPTFVEHLCWEIATFTVIGSPLVMCGIFWMISYSEKLGRVQHAAEASLFLLFFILLVLYPISSMFLVGESVRQIFALPVESFREPQLTTYLPSFS